MAEGPPRSLATPIITWNLAGHWRGCSEASEEGKIIDYLLSQDDLGQLSGKIRSSKPFVAIHQVQGQPGLYENRSQKQNKDRS